MSMTKLLNRLIAAGLLATPVALPAATTCQQADARVARTARIDSAFSVTGAGGTQMADGTRMLVWTGTDCIAWIQFRGPLAVNADWQSFAPSPNAQFAAHDESATRRRDFALSPEGRVTFAVDGKQATMRDDDREWLRAMVLEYVRRAGVSAPARAREIATQGGVTELLAEARRIKRDDVRVRYLIAGYSFVDAAARASFIRDGAALLGTSDEAAEFLLAAPREWRSDERIIATVFDAAAQIEPDDFVEQILRAFSPTRPTPAALRPGIQRLISTLQSNDRRTALRAYYLDVAP